jgi:hypothetical protein
VTYVLVKSLRGVGGERQRKLKNDIHEERLCVVVKILIEKTMNKREFEQIFEASVLSEVFSFHITSNNWDCIVFSFLAAILHYS